MSQMTAEDVDDFLDYLSRKPCKGPKSYSKAPNAIPTLSYIDSLQKQQLLQSLRTGALQAQRGVQHKNFPRLAGSLAGQTGV